LEKQDALHRGYAELNKEIHLTRLSNDAISIKEVNDQNSSENDLTNRRHGARKENVENSKWLQNKTLPYANQEKKVSDYNLNKISLIKNVDNYSSADQQKSSSPQQAADSLLKISEDKCLPSRNRHRSHDQPPVDQSNFSADQQNSTSNINNTETRFSKNIYSHMSDVAHEAKPDRDTNLDSTEMEHNLQTLRNRKKDSTEKIDMDYIAKISKIDSDYISRLADKFSDRAKNETDVHSTSMLKDSKEDTIRMPSEHNIEIKAKKTSSEKEDIFKPGFLLRSNSKKTNITKEHTATYKSENGEVSDVTSKTLFNNNLDDRTRQNNIQNRKQAGSIFPSGFLLERKDGVQDSTSNSLKVGRFLVEDSLSRVQPRKPEVTLVSSPSFSAEKDWRGGRFLNESQRSEMGGKDAWKEDNNLTMAHRLPVSTARGPG
jgi:hypothetical protein